MSVSLERLLELHTQQDEDNFGILRTEITALRADVAELQATLTSYKGFIGGVVFVVGALFAAVALAVSYVK